MSTTHPIDVVSPVVAPQEQRLPAEQDEFAPSIDSPELTFPRQQPSFRQRLKGQLIRLGCFFLVYVLSIGPMFWSWYEACYVGGSQFLVAFYAPLVWLCDSVPLFGWLVNWYLNWWIL